MRCVYRARYLSTCPGPPNGRLAYTTQSFRYKDRTKAWNAAVLDNVRSLPKKRKRPRACACLRPSRYLPRKTRLKTFTGRKNPGRHETHRGDASILADASQERPPPVTTP